MTTPRQQSETRLIEADAATVRSPVEPDARVLFAAERNLLAWIRTGLALMGFGFVVARFSLFFRELAASARTAPVPGPSHFLGIGLIVLGIVVNAIAVVQHFQLLGKINRGESLFPAPPSPGVFIAGALGVLGVLIALYLLSLIR